MNKLEKSALLGVRKSSKVKRASSSATSKLVAFDELVISERKKVRQITFDKEFNYGLTIALKAATFQEAPLGACLCVFLCALFFLLFSSLSPPHSLSALKLTPGLTHAQAVMRCRR